MSGYHYDAKELADWVIHSFENPETADVDANYFNRKNPGFADLIKRLLKEEVKRKKEADVEATLEKTREALARQMSQQINNERAMKCQSVI